MPRFSPKQNLFIEHLLANGLNASDAARKAGYSERTAEHMGWENLQKPQIKEEIARRINERLSNIEELHFLWLQECRTLAFSQPTEGNNYGVEMAAKVGALQLLGRYLQFARAKDSGGDIVLEISDDDAALL